MTHLALDLSKRSTGFALWHPGLEKPVCGTWELGSELTTLGRVFLRLHQRIHEIHSITPLECVAYEKPRHLDGFNQQSNADSHYQLVGLGAHVESYCEAKGIRRCGYVHQATWRRTFLGKMPRATKTSELKGMAMERCRQLGLAAQKHDAAEAIGILDYMLDRDRIFAPWRRGVVFDLPLGEQP